MATTYTRWNSSSTSATLSGFVRVAPGQSITSPVIVFRFKDKSYLDLTEAEASDSNVAAWFSASGLVNFNLSALAAAFTDDQHTAYYSATGSPQAFGITSFEDGVYHYTFTNGSDVEAQYVIFMPEIEEAIEALAKKLIDSQCNCQLNRSVMDNFVKAKALQQLIYAKVLDMGTTYNATNFDDVNADIKVLSDFLEGTNDVCGC